MSLAPACPDKGFWFEATRPAAPAPKASRVVMCLLFLALLISLAPPTAQAFDQLTYMTEEYYPFNYSESGALKGVSVDVLRLVWKELDVAPQPIHILPWARAYEQASTVRDTVLFSMARIPQREERFHWAGPIATTRFVLVAKKTSRISIRDLAQATGYRIGTLRDDVSDLLLQEHAKRNKVEPLADMHQNIRKLEKGRLDMVAYEESAWKQLVLKNGLSPDDYETVYVLRETPVFFAFHQDVRASLVERFQQALDRVKKTCAYQGILDDYLR